MKKLASILSIVGIIGIIGVFAFTRNHISLIIPALPILVLFKTIFLSGILSSISVYSERNSFKTISFSLYIIGAVSSILSVLSIISIDLYLIEIALIISSYIIMIGNCFQGLVKSLILISLILPLLLVLGINNSIITTIGLGYLIIIGILSSLKTIKN